MGNMVVDRKRAGPEPVPKQRVFRFAPSPNGFLHRGHAFSALLNAHLAEVTGGRFLLRIEDIDRERTRPEFVAAIAEDLGWLGLRWETPVLRQSERGEAYRAALAELKTLDLIYPAFLSRAETQARVLEAEATGRPWPRDPDSAPVYPGGERDWPAALRQEAVASGRPYVLRLDMRRALTALPDLSWREVDPLGANTDVVRPADPGAWGDVVIARKGMPGSYHLAVIVDDAFQGVTHVVRGRDLQAATAVHRLLHSLLGVPEPHYVHHRLLLDDAGQKLAKSRGSETIRAYRAAGATAQDLIAGLDLPSNL
jgi:glutamyl-Q tRNA(Asp) synthetase